MLLKWAIGGLIVGAIAGIFVGDIVIGALGGAVFAVILRKWIFRNLWM